jgi:hypothetical protein
MLSSKLKLFAAANILGRLVDCKHRNLNVYDYVRDDGSIEAGETPTRIRLCLDCGATQRYRVTREPEEWCIPWIWREHKS